MYRPAGDEDTVDDEAEVIISHNVCPDLKSQPKDCREGQPARVEAEISTSVKRNLL
jgi:hypothetical protein